MPKIDSIGAGHFDAVRDGGGGDPGDSGQGDEQQPPSQAKSEIASPHPEDDRLERSLRKTHGAVTARPSGLPTGAEPGAEEQIAGMRARLAELENTFQYIGTGHPDFHKMKAEVDQLRGMLDAFDRGA